MIKYLFVALFAGFLIGGAASYLWRQHQDSAMMDIYRKNQPGVNKRMSNTVHGLPVRNNKDVN